MPCGIIVYKNVGVSEVKLQDSTNQHTSFIIYPVSDWFGFVTEYQELYHLGK